MVKGALLKKLNEKTPDFIKKIAFKPIRNKLIKNPVFLDTYNEIESFKGLSKEEQEHINRQQLKETLIYAYENIKYYKDTFKAFDFDPYKFQNLEELKKLPYLDKARVMENFNDLISEKDIDHYVAYTGGSTGKPLKMLLDTASIYKEKAFVYNFWSTLGYDYKKSRIITLRGVEFENRFYKYNPLDNQIILSPFKLNENTLHKYIEVIEKFKPEFFHGYASAFMHLSKLVNKHNIKLKTKIKGIFFVSENVDEKERKYIEDTFNCKSLIFYGHSERAVFGEEIEGSYSFNKLYGYTELIPLDEPNVYKIACTGFINKKMPLIRYVPDDVVMVEDNKYKILGHWDKEILIGKNEERVSMAAINFHSAVFNKIRMYQFEQFKKGEVILNIVQDAPLTLKDINEIKGALETKIKGVLDINIQIVDNIELTNRGKVKKILQHMK